MSAFFVYCTQIQETENSNDLDKNRKVCYNINEIKKAAYV